MATLTQAGARTLWRSHVNGADSSVLPDATADYYLLGGLEAANADLLFNIEEDSTNLTALDETYDLAGDVVEVIHVLHGARAPLVRSDFATWRARGIDWVNCDPDFPQEYAVHGRVLTLWPRPSAAAVAFGSAITTRTVDSPADTADAVWAKLADQDQRIPVYWAVAEYCAAPWRRAQGPEAAKVYMELYQQRIERARLVYGRRFLP